jgi:putative proteasome-type protease
MTYCVGLLVDTGLVMLSDSRTNAGVDQINTFRKMATFQHAHDRVLVLMSAGNLGITQAVINLLEMPEEGTQATRFLSATNMFNAARVVGAPSISAMPWICGNTAMTSTAPSF